MKRYPLFSIIALSISLLVFSCKSETPPKVGTEAEATQLKEQIVQAPKPIAQASTDNHSSTGNLSWSSMNDVEGLVKKDKKKVIVDVYTKWCGPCKLMDARTFTDPAVQAAINKDFHAVKFDAEGPDAINFKGKTWENKKFNPTRTKGRNAAHDLTSFFAVRGYPTLVVLDENFNIIKKIVGYKTPEQLLAEIATI